jgi:hypothetical protein
MEMISLKIKLESKGLRIAWVWHSIEVDLFSLAC